MAVPVLGDPQARVLVVRVMILVALVALIAPLDIAWSLVVGLVGAVVLAAVLAAELRTLRTRIHALVPDTEPAAGVASVRELGTLVERARAGLAEARRKAEHERDDVLGILEATSEGILVLGHHHRIEMINDAAHRLLQPPADPLGRTLHEICRERGLLEYADALRRGQSVRPRTIELPAGGEHVRVVSVSGALVRGDRLRSRAVLVLHDLTDVQRLESVRTDFVANVTHEMRSPLTSILGYAETLAEDTELPPGERRDYLERILRNSRRLDDIIRDLIELSRLEHATASEVAATDLAKLLAETVGRSRDLAGDRGVALTVRPDGLPATVEIDAALVRQALANLVDNAVKYTPAGGRVDVTAELREAEGARKLAIIVADTGPGIPREHRGRIFERSYRVDTARSRSLGGTGLGLAIVKHAAALHGGGVALESGTSGSPFRVVLPLPASAV